MTDRHAALRRSLEGSQVALRRLAAISGRPTHSRAAAAASRRQRRARNTSPSTTPWRPAAPRPAVAAARPVAGLRRIHQRPASSPTARARPGGPVQHTPPRSPVQREVFADDYDEAEAVETDDGQTAGDEDDDDVCAACGRQPPTMRCPCLTASYCSRECQRAHWRTHKRACPLRRSRASSRTASEVSVAAEAAVATNSTQNGDRREGEAYARRRRRPTTARPRRAPMRTPTSGAEAGPTPPRRTVDRGGLRRLGRVGRRRRDRRREPRRPDSATVAKARPATTSRPRGSRPRARPRPQPTGARRAPRARRRSSSVSGPRPTRRRRPRSLI